MGTWEAQRNLAAAYFPIRTCTTNLQSLKCSLSDRPRLLGTDAAATCLPAKTRVCFQ